MKIAYRIALFCGATPLILGIAIFLAWLVTRWDWLSVAGILNIAGGLALFALGLASLAFFVWAGIRDSRVSSKKLASSSLLCAALLFSNFPVAIGIIAAVMHLEARMHYGVVVVNQLPEPLDNARLEGGGVKVDLGTIEPGNRNYARLSFQRDGSLEFYAQAGKKKISSCVEEYVTGYMGGDKCVTVKADGTVTVENMPD